MIKCSLQGQLGNTLFQIAATLSHALDCNQPWMTSTWKYQNYFANQVPQGTIPYSFSYYKEPGFHYTPIPCQGPTELKGYFQSFKYFEKHQDKVKEQFTPTQEIINYTNINRPEGILTGIHIRRTDYLKMSHYYHILDNEYYNKALATLTNPGKTIVFSDDIPWCQQNFPADYYSVGNSGQDLFLLASCDNVVMANSSFSWWASYLSQANIITPKDWFKPISGHDTKDLYLESWTQL